MQYLKNKTVVITGISKGIGKALALRLLKEGCTVIGWGLSAPDYEDEKLHFIQCDVSDDALVSAAAEKTKRISPEVHFLVNNAGFGYFSPIETFDTTKFRRMLEVNVTGTFLVTKALVPVMKAQEAGHILNISSVAGRVGMPQGEGYNASKFAVAGMSECLFHELRKEGIKVTTIYPGSTSTNFFDAIPGASAHGGMLDPAELAETLAHVMNTSPNFLIRELEVRPLDSKKRG